MVVKLHLCVLSHTVQT